MIALRATAVALALMVVVLVPKLDVYPLWLELLAATLALCGAAVAIAVGWPPRPEPLIDGKWQPAPPDLDAIAGHAAALNSVPAVAPAPVDELLATVPRPAPVAVLEDTPMPTMTPAEHASAVEAGLWGLADRLDSYAAEQNAVLNRFAELLAGRVHEIDGRIDNIDDRLSAIEQRLSGDG